MSTYIYPSRNFAPPSGWTIPVLTSDLITNELLNLLYPYWSCSLAQQATPSIQNLKKGVIEKYPCSVQFLEDGLYILSDWYNGGFILNPVGSFTYGAGYTTSLYWANTNTDNSGKVPLVLNVPHGNNINTFITNLNSLLPQGYTASILSNGFSIYIETTNALQQYLYVVNMLNSVIVSSGIMTIDFWSCIPYSVVQNLVENLNKTAGCPNCGNTTIIETDNFYVSKGMQSQATLNQGSSYSNTYYQ